MYFNYSHYFECPLQVYENVKPSERDKVDSVQLIKLMSNITLCDVHKDTRVTTCENSQSADRLKLNRDLLENYGQGDIVTSLFGDRFKSNSIGAAEIPNIVHYVWCGDKFFRFEDYLGVLSMLRVLKPFKLVFHYDKLPLERDLYNTWFQELKQSVSFLVLRKTNKAINCLTTDALNYGLEQIALNPYGGFYFGERAILAYIPAIWKQETNVSYIVPGTSQSEESIVFSKFGLYKFNMTLEQYKASILKNAIVCSTIDAFNTRILNSTLVGNVQITPDRIVSPCIVAPSPLFPEGIVNSSSPFGRIARVVYYGKSEPLLAQQGEDSEDLIPAISHMIMLNSKKPEPIELTFSHYLSILSALYLGGFERVYVHGDTVPSGVWWDKLQNESVFFLYVEEVETVFQQEVKVYAHQSDILRSLILLKYGGAYQDKDALWTSPVPNNVRRYPAVACYDWVDRGEWPRSFNTGIFLAKPGAMYLKKFLESFWFQWDSSWIFNGVLMPYKIYERNPDTLFIYRKLQTICYLNVCHPAWHEDYMRDENLASQPTGDFKLEETNALHYTHPKPDDILNSFDDVKKGKSPLHELGQKLMETIVSAGKKNLLQ